MTPDELVERVARELYEKARKEFHEDPVTISCGPDFGDEVFPPWEEVDNKDRWYSDARAAIAIVLEEAAQLVDASECYWSGEAERRDELADAIRALIPSSDDASSTHS